MAASTITRDTWTNDSGTTSAPVGDGTILNNSVLQNHVYARIDAMFAGAGAYTTFELGGLLKADGFGTHTFSAGGTGVNALSIRNTTAGTGNAASLWLGNDANNQSGILTALSSTYTTSAYAVADGTLLLANRAGGLSLAAAHASGIIRFASGNAIWMQLDASGLLSVSGFGTHTFSAGGTGNNQIQIRNTTAGTGNASALVIGNNTSGSTAFIAVYSTTYTPSLYALADGTAMVATGAGGLSLAASNASGVIRFYTGATPTEQMRIFASGGVSIGNTTDAGLSVLNVETSVVAGYHGVGVQAYSTLAPDGVQYVDAAGAEAARTGATGFKMTAWPTTAAATNAVVGDTDFLRRSTSLRANKHDIVTITASEAIQAVAALRPVLYRSRVDDDQRQWPGFIAEEIETAAPHLATYGPDGVLQSVAYDRVGAYLVAAVQALTARVSALEAA